MPSALGIEAVEVLSEGGPTVLVRISGRWRRRRPEWPRQAMLVVEVEGTRHRFPAMPEPPSLTGAVPGTWRMSFSVPSELEPQLERRAWLQLGAIVVPLPVAGAIEAGGRGPPADPEVLAARQLRGSELALEHARRRASEAEATAAELAARFARLERELAQARTEPERIRASLAARVHELRRAEQRVHAEQALRLEIEERLAAVHEVKGALREAFGELAGREAYIRELEGELESARRAAAEAEHLAATRGAAAAQEPAVGSAAVSEPAAPPVPREAAAPQAPREAPPPGSLERRASTIRAESALAAELRNASRPAARPARAPDQRQPRLAALLRSERELPAPESALERERAARTAAERRGVELERELAEQKARAARITAAIADIRSELRQLRHELAESSPPERLAESPAQESGPVQADHLSAALARLREATSAPPPPELAPEPRLAGPVKPWLRHVFGRLAAQDPPTAGRLVIALLPAQHLAVRRPVAYDLVIGDLASVQVSAGAGATRVEFAAGPRAASEVDFRVAGDLASLARLLAAGRVRRRLGRGVARVRGDRARLSALEQLIAAPLNLRDLHEAGVRLDPALALTVASLMIEPGWTAGERFTIAYEVPGARLALAFLHVRDGRAPVVLDRPAAGDAEATIVASPDLLLRALAGGRPPEVFVRGDQRLLRLIAGWLARAQSG
jgi:hypothetical protein